MQKNAPIGVLDSGVGGLSVLKCLQAALPQEDFIYVGDTARTPYGPRSEAEVRRFVGEIIDYLDGRGVKLVVIACNTLTVLGVDTLKGSHAFEIVGMSKGAQLVLAASSRKKIGVFATEFTINSGAHKAAILAADDGADVYPQACPKFVPLIEGVGMFLEGGAALIILAPLMVPIVKAAGIDTLILSCTHYPFIQKEIESEFGSEVTVIDPADATAQDTKTVLAAEGLLRSEGAGTLEVCFTADVERGARIAGRVLPQGKCLFKEIKL
jgi:glutamate racemase